MRNSPPISKRCSVVLRSWILPNRKRPSADECVRLRCRDVPSRRPQKSTEHPLSFECEAPRFGDSKDAPFSHQILAGLRHQVPAGVRCCVSLQPTLRCDHVRGSLTESRAGLRSRSPTAQPPARSFELSGRDLNPRFGCASCTARAIDAPGRRAPKPRRSVSAPLDVTRLCSTATHFHPPSQYSKGAVRIFTARVTTRTRFA